MTTKAKDSATDDLVEYRVQDLPEDRIPDALEFMLRDQFLKEEQLQNGVGVKDDPEALQEWQEFVTIFLNEKLTLVCFKEGCEEIVSLNMLYVEEVVDEDVSLPLKSETLRRLLKIGHYISEKSRSVEPKNAKFVLKGLGLSVDQKYRRRGIAVKMLEARVPLMKQIGLTTTSTIFTGIGSQNAAKFAGYKEYVEITYDELAANGHVLKDVKEHSVKTMGLQISN